jgi:hypothetical protein
MPLDAKINFGNVLIRIAGSALKRELWHAHSIDHALISKFAKFCDFKKACL